MAMKVQEITLVVDISIVPMTQSSTVTIVFISERQISSISFIFGQSSNTGDT